MSSTDQHSNRNIYYVTSNEATIAYWTCGALSLLILFARLIGHFYQHRRRKCDATTIVVLASVGTLIARTALNEVVLDRGTATIVTASGESLDQEIENAARIRLGTILTLVVRVIVTTYYWLQTVLLLLFYKTTLDHIPWSHRLIQVAWPTIVLTWIGVVLATFLECRPFSLYWEVSSDGEHACTRAYIQLQLQAACNILLDILLLVLSLPIARAQLRLWPKNLQLGCLYVLGFLCMIITGVRVAFIYRDGGVQYARSFWASIQVLVATAVANGPSIYGACKVMKRRKESDLSLGRLRSASLAGGEWSGWREAGVPANAASPSWNVQMRGVG